MKNLPSRRKYTDETTTMISLRMPVELQKALKEQATQRGVTLTYLLISILDSAAEELEQEALPTKKKKR
ncbi:MAG TPA: hypothetical protein VN132_13785 [Bdellovibrio sp.]|nr:hypothetical protein [Bdellovibrio sp.]